MHEMIAGTLIAIFLSVGRWNPSRLEEGEGSSGDMLAEPRLWAIIGLLYVTSLGLLIPSNTIHSGTALSKPSSRWLVALLFSLLAYMAISSLWSPDHERAVWKLYEVALLVFSLVGLLLCSRSLDFRR